MSESLTANVLGKRSASDDPQPDSTKQKKKKIKQTLSESENKKRKIALLVSYNGKGYYGVQIQKNFVTIESELFAALIKAGAWNPEVAENPSKMWFQRGSRTDKGVSAAGQTFSLQAILVPDLIQKVNNELPEKIKIMHYVRTTKGFDAKNFCDSRTYMYMLPTFAFADIEQFVTGDYRIEDKKIERARQILKRFIGTHNFHNFTSGVKFSEKRAFRYIISFECSDPYIRDGMEFATIRVKGQSFMLHQIRKMIGLTIAVVRGYCGEETIDKCWKGDQVDVPKAPGLGLVLEELHFEGYNKKFGRDGMHEPIDWSPCKEALEKFKDEHILADIVAEEKSEKVMFNWLRTLGYHNFDVARDEGPEKPWYRAKVFDKDLTQKDLSTDEADVHKATENSTSEISPLKNDAIKTSSESDQVIDNATVQGCGFDDKKDSTQTENIAEKTSILSTTIPIETSQSSTEQK